jgi:hypothetical protein
MDYSLNAIASVMNNPRMKTFSYSASPRESRFNLFSSIQMDSLVTAQNKFKYENMIPVRICDKEHGPKSATLPTEFFSEEFNITNDIVQGILFPPQSTNAIQIEVITSWLDLVEFDLLIETAKQQDKFAQTSLNFENLFEKIDFAHESICEARSCIESCTNINEQYFTILKLIDRKTNLQLLIEKTEELKLVVNMVDTLESLIENSEYLFALDVMEENRLESLENDFSSIHIIIQRLRHLQSTVHLNVQDFISQNILSYVVNGKENAQLNKYIHIVLKYTAIKEKVLKEVQSNLQYDLIIMLEEVCFLMQNLHRLVKDCYWRKAT